VGKAVAEKADQSSAHGSDLLEGRRVGLPQVEAEGAAGFGVPVAVQTDDGGHDAVRRVAKAIPVGA